MNADDLLAARFGDAAPTVSIDPDAIPISIATQLRRSSCRDYAYRPVHDDLITLIVAAALSAPSKSDLQQATIIQLTDPDTRRLVCELSPANSWALDAPLLFVLCADGSRIRRAARRLERPFPNNHLDQFMNAVVDCGIVLSAAVHAAEAFGLGACPISEIRDRPAQLIELLGLPDHVVPVAGLAVGWPADTHRSVTQRLPLRVTWHHNRYDDDAFDDAFDAYESDRDRDRRVQRDIERFGVTRPYGWAEDRTRQYSTPRRADWGRAVRAQGFGLG
jgi:nitroreductase/FMN reductase [NAD(P)H]